MASSPSSLPPNGFLFTSVQFFVSMCHANNSNWIPHLNTKILDFGDLFRISIGPNLKIIQNFVFTQKTNILIHHIDTPQMLKFLILGPQNGQN